MSPSVILITLVISDVILIIMSPGVILMTRESYCYLDDSLVRPVVILITLRES